MIPTLAKTELTIIAAAKQVRGERSRSSSIATDAKVNPAKS
jgi:hypothetical protein